MPDELQITDDIFSIFFDNTPDLLCITDREGRFLRVNASWQKILGYTTDEIIGSTYADFIKAEDLKNDQAIIAQLNQDQSLNEVNHYVNRYSCKEGGCRYLEWGSRRLGDYFFCIARDITERIEYERQIEYLSYHDQLTNLYNRRFIEEELKRLDTERNLPISLIIGDLNRLKLVNDAFGHARGDELIKLAAQALRSSCRPDDLIGRIGGDEFIMLLPRTPLENAREIIDRIARHTSAVEVSGVPLSLSLGCSAKNTPDQLLDDVYRDAEKAMYAMKSVMNERSQLVVIND